MKSEKQIKNTIARLGMKISELNLKLIRAEYANDEHLVRILLTNKNQLIGQRSALEWVLNDEL